MLNIVKNILFWADKEPISFDDWPVFFRENIFSLKFQIAQRGFELRSIDDIVNPPSGIASRLCEVMDILLSATDSLEYHPTAIEAVVRSLGNKAIVKRQSLFFFLYERYLVVPPSLKIRNPQARGIDYALADGLARHFTWEDFDKIQALIENEALGESRMLLLNAFPGFLHKEEVRQLLSGLTDHPVFAFEAKRLLKRKVRKVRKKA